MGSYRIEWKHSALKELKQLPKDVVARIMRAVGQLPENPYPSGIRKLVGSENSYRILYSIVSSTLIIEIIRIGHRKDVYD